MSLILHLSDLHLGSPRPWQHHTDDKFGLDPEQRSTKVDTLRNTLSRLGERLQRDGQDLDAVVVSGDITNANEDDGYQALGPLLGELGDALPDRARIVVVPGNHDADWAQQPAEPRKFDGFIRYVRRHYATPLLDGVDFDPKGAARNPGSRGRSTPVVDLSDAVIVALNSSAFCGTTETRTTTPWTDLIDAFPAPDESEPAKQEAALIRKQAREDLERLRTHDMARISPGQIRALDSKIKNGDAALDGPVDSDARVRIAVLHHPIGPVSDAEEIKSFETITNLAALRSHLYDRGIHVVLHGHKHATYFGWDYVGPPGDELDRSARRVLVVGAPGDFQVDQTVCRLVETCPDGRPVAGAPRIRVIDVKGVRPGQQIAIDRDAPAISLAQPVDAESGRVVSLVRGQTADAAYEQLRARLPNSGYLGGMVVSIVEDAASTAQLPTNFPSETHPSGGWLSDLARWWQLADPKAVTAFAGMAYNHGQRLYGRGWDAVAAAAQALPSSKAIAILVDPKDEAGHENVEFPAFTMVQFVLRDERKFLDCVGFFRKQDLRLWWPVNMAELAAIQEHARQKSGMDVALGRLIAVATIGLHDDVLPEMAGTRIDRAVDLDPDLYHRLAYLVAHPNEGTEQAWNEVLLDVGELQDGEVVIPSIGLKSLVEALQMHLELASDPRVRGVLKAVKTLSDDAGAARWQPDQAYWSEKLRADVADIMKAVRKAIRDA